MHTELMAGRDYSNTNRPSLAIPSLKAMCPTATTGVALEREVEVELTDYPP